MSIHPRPGQPPISDCEIIVGDGLDVMARLDPGCARLVFADPPYNIGEEYGEHHNDRMKPGDDLVWCERWIRAAVQLLSPDGSLWLLIIHEWSPRLRIAAEAAGLHHRHGLAAGESVNRAGIAGYAPAGPIIGLIDPFPLPSGSGPIDG